MNQDRGERSSKDVVYVSVCAVLSERRVAQLVEECFNFAAASILFPLASQKLKSIILCIVSVVSIARYERYTISLKLGS